MCLQQLYNKISVYRSARDNKGQAMTIAEFMAMGKDYANIITAHRVLREEMRQKYAEYDSLIERRSELSEIVSIGYNPLRDNAKQEYDAAVHELEQVNQVIELLDNELKSAKSHADALKRSLPSATLSGLFYPKRAADNLVQHSGFMCVDIDDHVNHLDADGHKVVRPQSLDNVLELCSELPWVMYASHSVGGVGYFLLIPLGPIDEPHTHEWYFECLEAEFLQYGLVIDPACSDVSRLRFLSYDKHPYRNAKATPYLGRAGFVGRAEQKRIADEQRRRLQAQQLSSRITNDPDRKLSHVMACVEQIESSCLDITGSYDTCIKIGMSLHDLGSVGLSIWDRICRYRGSNHSQLRTYEELERKWHTFGSSGAHSLNVSWFFNYVAKEFNIYAKKQV